MGINNVILDTVAPEEVRLADLLDMNSDTETEPAALEYGITPNDLSTLKKNVSAIRQIVPMSTTMVDVSGNQRIASTNVVGTSANYPQVMSHKVPRRGDSLRRWMTRIWLRCAC